MTSAEEIARALGGKKTGNGWIAKCPCHEDSSPSLSIGEGEEGKPLLKCFAGCENTRLIEYLRGRGLWSSGSKQNGTHEPGPDPIVKRYIYRDELGNPVFEKIRTLRKRFWFEPAGITPMLYNLPGIIDAREEGAPVIIVEGEKDADTLIALGYVATSNPNGWSGWRPEFAETLRGMDVIFCGDNDEPGEKLAKSVTESMRDTAALFRRVRVPQPFKDVSDYFIAGHTKEDFDALIASAEGARGVPESPPEKVPDASPEAPNEKLRAVDLCDFLTLEITPREMMLAPWLTMQSLNMIHAYRGAGKTFFCLEVALSVALGRESMNNWEAPKPRKVLYIDGEMPAADLQERLRNLISTSPERGFFHLVNPFFQSGGMPDLSESESRAVVTGLIAQTGAELVVLDNLSCLIRGEHAENDAKWWEPVQPWALHMRNSGVAMVFVHHSGKTLKQRGTSKKEDIMDTVIALERPPEARAEDGAIFNVRFEKNRSIHGKSVEIFEAKLQAVNGVNRWCTKSREQSTRDRVQALFEEGYSEREIAEKLQIAKSTVGYHIKKLKQLVSDDDY